MKRFLGLLLVASLLTGCSNVASPRTVDVKVFFVADTPRGFKLFSEVQEFKEQDDLTEFIISQLISGAISPKDPNYVNLWDNSHSLNSITYSDSVATVDFSLGKLNVGSEGELRAIDQIVWTLTELTDRISAVRFTVNGQTVETFAGHVDTSDTFMRSPEYEVLNPIQIESIVEGDQLSNPVSISGNACTFEANVVWTLLKDGQMIDEGFTTAAAACPERSAWKVSLPELESGRYTFEAKEFSAEDGSLFAIDDKTFVIK